MVRPKTESKSECKCSQFYAGPTTQTGPRTTSEPSLLATGEGEASPATEADNPSRDVDPEANDQSVGFS